MRIRSLLPTAVLAAAAYFALFGGEYGLFEVWRLERQKVEEIRRLEELRAEVEVLRTRADSLENDPAALERLARERYGMIRDGERLYRFVGRAEAAGKAGDARAADTGS